MENASNNGHRQRLRARFLAGDVDARSDVALLELLLTYAIPQRDVQPLARALIARFGNLSGVLDASVDALCAVDGIKEHSAVLLKVVEYLRHSNGIILESAENLPVPKVNPNQVPLFALPAVVESEPEPEIARQEPTTSPESKRRKPVPRRGSGVFSNALFQEICDLLPRLPESESLDDVAAFARANLPFSSETTRKRYVSYVTRRMFLDGVADRALRHFAKLYAGTQSLRDVVFYRFCCAEPLMRDVMLDVLTPAIPIGTVERSNVRAYIAEKFPETGNLTDSVKAIAQVLGESHLAQVDRKQFRFAWREIAIPAFAFVLHSEFPEPGIHNLEKLEQNDAMRALLWKQERILPALYELRSRGVIPKISEIDTVRQFSTRYTLDELVEQLGQGALG